MKADRNAEIGTEIPRLDKIAHMPGFDHEITAIHDDEYAKSRGFRGNLVGGSLLLGYVLQMLYKHFGSDWMTYGTIDVSFIGAGAISGDKLRASGILTEKKEEESGMRLFLDVGLDNLTTGKKIVVGRAGCLIPQYRN